MHAHAAVYRAQGQRQPLLGAPSGSQTGAAEAVSSRCCSPCGLVRGRPTDMLLLTSFCLACCCSKSIPMSKCIHMDDSESRSSTSGLFVLSNIWMMQAL